LIDHVLADAHVQRDFRPQGVVCTVEVSLDAQTKEFG
jgi:hypothetical protein